MKHRIVLRCEAHSLRDIALKLRQHASFEGRQHLQIFNDSHLAARRFIP